MKDSLRDEFVEAIKDGSKGFFAPLVAAFKAARNDGALSSYTVQQHHDKDEIKDHFKLD